MPFFYFFPFQVVDCLLNRTRVSDVVEKGIGAPTVENSWADTSLGLASERKPKAPLSAPLGASKASQDNDIDIIHNEETPVFFFEDFVKGPGHISSTILLSAPFWPLLVRDFWEFVIDYQFSFRCLVRPSRSQQKFPARVPHVVSSYHCSETCFSIVFFPLWLLITLM